MKYGGQIQADYWFEKHLGPRFMTAGVRISLCVSDTYSFTSEATWPESDYTLAVERGVRDGLLESGCDPDEGVNIILKSIAWHTVDSSEQAFYLAAKCATKSHIDLH